MIALKRLVPAALAASLLLGLAAPGAGAAMKVEVLDSAGATEDRAGAHPDRVITRFDLGDSGGVREELKEVTFDFPPGMGGDPNAVPICSRVTFENERCPPESQVGAFVVERVNGTESIPIYGIGPAPGEVAAFGIWQAFLRSKIATRLRPADYGLSMHAADLFQESLFEDFLSPTLSARFEFWGVPADRQDGTAIPRRAFLTAPTRCDGPLSITARFRTWQRPEVLVTETGDSGAPLRGCEELAFEPRLDLRLEDAAVDTPTGVELSLTASTNDDPDGRVPAQVEGVRVTLPEGMSLSLGAAKAIAACTDAELGLGEDSPVACPPSSKVGTVRVSTPQLAAPIGGLIYLGQQLPGERFRIFIAASGAGAQVKMTGALRPDPATGRLTTVIDDLPGVAFSEMAMRFDRGPRALLVSPLRCGNATASAVFTPSSGTGPVTSTSTVQTRFPGRSSCPSPAPFDPGFSAGGSSQRGGKATTFSATLSRRGGEQLPDRFNILFPPGLGAEMGSVALCPEAAAAAGSCPGASRIGSSLAEVGSGPNPAVLRGGLYLTGPYRRAPYGFAMVFPAKVGAFDLGTIVVRSAVRIDPNSGQVRVETSSLPQTFEGIPIRFQTIAMEVERPGFMRNPTSCAPAEVKATVHSAAGTVARPSTPFRVGGCVALPFRPNFSFALKGREELRRGGKPGFEIGLRTRDGGANLRRADVLLPRVLKLDAAGLRALCSQRAAAVGKCPRAARVGSATARSPLLGESLSGSIFVAQPEGSGPPDLWTRLSGRGIELNVRSETAIEDGRASTRLTDLPDLPLASLRMKFFAGSRGLFELDRGLCVGSRARSLFADVEAEGQNHARRQSRAPVTAQPTCPQRG